MLKKIWHALGFSGGDSLTGSPSQEGFGHSTGIRVDWDGEKFHGGFGPTLLDTIDYHTLRTRSAQLFRRNIYARGILRRFITNIINTGLMLEATPDADMVGVEEEELADLEETIETRFDLWASSASHVDCQRQENLYQLQASIVLDAMICGDMLVVADVERGTGLPILRTYKSEEVRSPLNVPELPPGHRIVEGVQLDSLRRHVGYWVGEELTQTFIPAWGSSGRRLAWLVYGTDKRRGDVRGEPILGIIIQSLKEIDRYRDAAIRKAVINAMLAIFVKKTVAAPGTAPFSTSGGAVRKSAAVAEQASAAPRDYRSTKLHPGMIIEELQVGEEPVSFGDKGTDVKFGDFEAAIVHAMSWALEIPAEILTLAFSSNYSASQAAVNEFRLFLDRIRYWFGSQICTPVYREWFLVEVLTGRIKAPGFLESRTDPGAYAQYLSWLSCEWSGPVKPSTDQLKMLKAADLSIQLGLQTPSQATRDIYGTKFRSNIRRARREVALLREIREALGVIPAPAAAPSGEAEPEDDTVPEGDGKDGQDGEQENAA